MMQRKKMSQELTTSVGLTQINYQKWVIVAAAVVPQKEWN